MYRQILLLTLITLLSLGETRRHKNHKRHRNENCSEKHDEKLFKKIAYEVIDADRNAQRYCTMHKTEAKEIYGRDGYRVYVPAKGHNETDVTIKIKHRVVFVKVEKASAVDKDSKEVKETVFTQIVVLPDIVDEDKATWMMINEEIEITVPYEVEFDKEVPVTCEDEIDDDTEDLKHKRVSVSAPSNNGEFIVPVGDINRNLVQ